MFAVPVGLGQAPPGLLAGLAAGDPAEGEAGQFSYGGIDAQHFVEAADPGVIGRIEAGADVELPGGVVFVMADEGGVLAVVDDFAGGEHWGIGGIGERPGICAAVVTHSGCREPQVGLSDNCGVGGRGIR